MLKHALLLFTATAISMLFGTMRMEAQSAMLNLPDSSQAARVAQRIGITDITIDYHRPLVRGRKIFGGLEPYGKVWRAGANVNTTISFSDPVIINGQALAQGKYGLHMIPGETSWVVIFSKNSAAWGSFTYNPAEDALRITVKPETIANQEALKYDFDDLDANSAILSMLWEKVAVRFKVEVKTAEIVEKSLRSQLQGRIQFEWQHWEEAANYLLDNKLSAQEAEQDAERSVELEDRFENEMTKVRALTALGRGDEAQTAKNKAIAIGSQSQIHDFGRRLQREGRQADAFDLFTGNIKKDPNTWMAHNEAARIAVSKSDFATAIKEMKLAADASPGPLKTQHNDLIRQLENKVDINK